MTDSFANVNGYPLTSAEVHVPSRGAWFADVDFAEDPTLSGRVTLNVGTLALSGTIVPDNDGTFGLRRRSRIVGGAGGWGTMLSPKAYHSDGGVKALLVAQDAAREAGETLGTFSARTNVGNDYVRQASPASRVLEDAIGGVSWWVDYAGVTQVGPRSTSTPLAGSYDLLEYDPRSNIATFITDDLGAVVIGSVLSDRLDAPQTVRELTIRVTSEMATVEAHCGADSDSHGRLADAVRSLVERLTDSGLYGPRKYRVLGMSGDRVKLQAVKRDAGLPDIEPISMWPGMSGLHATLTPGVEVLVSFIDGDRAQPIVTHFAGKDGQAWAPTELVLDATLIKAGKNATDFVALASKVHDELALIANAFSTFLPGSGGASFPHAYTTVGAIAASKVKAE